MSALVLYGLITVVCSGFLFFMAIFGADQDIDVDVDIDTDVGLDGFEAGGPSVLSLKLILIFFIGLGSAVSWPPISRPRPITLSWP